MGDDTALILACESGDEELVQFYLMQGADVDLCNAGLTLLMLAAKKGHDKVAEILLKYGANTEARSEAWNPYTPLLIACRANRFKVVELLLNYGANTECRGIGGETPMCLAAAWANVDIIKLLLGHGAEINADMRCYMPLMMAVMQESVATVEFLLDIGSNVNAQKFYMGETALHLAENLEIVKLCLDQGANLELRSKEGLTPFLEAAKVGCLGHAKMLLARGADMNAIVSSTGDNALTLAAANERFDNYHFVWFLLNNGIQVEWKNKKGESALWLAAKHNHSFSVKLLHHARADFLSKDHSGLSCLSIAFKKGHVRLVEWLLHHMKCDRVNGLTCDTRCRRITDRRLKEILLKGPDQ